MVHRFKVLLVSLDSGDRKQAVLKGFDNCWTFRIILFWPKTLHNTLDSQTVNYCGVRASLVRPGRRALRRSLRAVAGCLGVFVGSLPRLRRHVPVCGPLYSGLSSVEPVPLCGTLHGFPYYWVFYNGGSGPPRGQQSSIFPLVPTSGVYPHSVSVRLSSI